MQLKFLGATRCVTGSKYLLTTDQHRILIDCGLFQGRKELRLLNWENFPENPVGIDAVILTHAHIDHSGYLPLLIKNGFKGKVYCTSATKDLCSILLPDSGFLQEELAYFANKYGFSKHKPALPLYTKDDALQSLKHLIAIDFAKDYRLFDDVVIQFNRAGHILGAATILFKSENLNILFSGDLGRYNDLIMRAPVGIPKADYVIVESTYGSTSHLATNPSNDLAAIINRTIKRRGTVIIPAFAVGRAQTVLYLLYKLKQANLIPDIPIFLDSPMAIDATEIFLHHIKEHKLSAHEAANACKGVQYVTSVEQSKALDKDAGAKLIISASGMATGGRILHHIKAYAEDARNTILFTGFQAEGTRGDTLVNQHQKELKLLGKKIQISAEICALDNLSAHADGNEIISWLRNLIAPPRQTFVTHGEYHAALALYDQIGEKLGWSCTIPNYLEEIELL